MPMVSMSLGGRAPCLSGVGPGSRLRPEPAGCLGPAGDDPSREVGRKQESTKTLPYR